MTTTNKSMADQYGSVLQSYLADFKEEDLQRAYELGRLALAEGLGLLEMAAMHHTALTFCLMDVPAAQDRARTVRGAERFLIEGLTPFEMSLRGFQEANAALRTSEAKYRELVENASDIVFTTDLEGNFTSINKAAEQLTGYPTEEALKANFAQIVPPEFQETIREMLKRKRSGDETTTYQLEILTKQGQRLPIEASTRLLHREGKVVGVQGIARDIGDRKRGEAALIQLNEALEEQAKRIAHELHDESGQLLASVHIALNNDVARFLPPEAKSSVQGVKDLLERIEAQLRRLSHELRPTILDDLGLVPAIEFLTQGISERAQISIAVQGDTEGRLPNEVEIVLYRVVQEALNNVVKHAHAKQVQVSIGREGTTVHCSIRDDGDGFDSKQVAAQKGRWGLGLIGIKERLAVVNGKCIINTSPGQGTEILVTVPTESQSATSNHTR
jgi:two-component system sensor histidine kinase UhpB